jgi:hypothetical protein
MLARGEQEEPGRFRAADPLSGPGRVRQREAEGRAQGRVGEARQGLRCCFQRDRTRQIGKAERQRDVLLGPAKPLHASGRASHSRA